MPRRKQNRSPTAIDGSDRSPSARKRVIAATLGSSPTIREGVKAAVPREYVHSLRGKFKGKGLLKALLADKRNERSS
ncbi:MAG: hypothetical protein M3Y84_07965 [Acidobacteriota bacterium]|nr:hypothetical protein [Acidobacteriota bacterium]